MLSPYISQGQILFAEDCFTGGVTVTGAGNVGVTIGVKTEVRWQPGFEIRTVYALTHRFGHIAPHSMYVNGAEINWDISSQIGPETALSNPFSHPFAVHVRDVTAGIQIADSILNIDFPIQQFYPEGMNWGWWSIYLVILYEAPHIDQEVCFRLYTADQRQDMIQHYQFPTPPFMDSKPLLFSLFAARINNFESDKSRIRLNGEILGDIMGFDQTMPPTIGTQGHFYYEQGVALGLNGDTANNRFIHHDAIAVINEELIDQQSFSVSAVRILPTPGMSGNLHPAFNFTYTPSCPVISSDAMPRRYNLCRGDSAVLQGVAGFEHYAWTPALHLSDSTLMAPVSTPDSSGWYRLRMWNDDAAQGCPLTIPVWVEVGDVPRPPAPSASSSSCPNPTGTVRLANPPGDAPFVYTLGEASAATHIFNQVAPGSYPVSVTDARGCRWDSTLTVELSTNHTAAFTATPTEGFSPLQVLFSNQSTGSDSFIWLIDGEPFSTARNVSHSIPDSGYFEVSLIAIRDNDTCADTATVMIRVRPGIKIIVPNVFTPNGDGANDRLVVQTIGAASLTWQVYNRWGNLLHSGSASPTPNELTDVLLWDGHSHAGPAPDGSYMLTLSAVGPTGMVEQMQVAVSVRR